MSFTKSESQYDMNCPNTQNITQLDIFSVLTMWNEINTNSPLPCLGGSTQFRLTQMFASLLLYHEMEFCIKIYHNIKKVALVGKGCNMLYLCVYLYYRPPMKLLEGNVFTRVCLFTEGGVHMWPLPMMHWTSVYRPSKPQLSSGHQTWDPSSPSPLEIRHGTPSFMLVTSGGDHWRPCSLEEAPSTQWYWHLVATKHVWLASGWYTSYWNAFLFQCTIRLAEPKWLRRLERLSAAHCGMGSSPTNAWRGEQVSHQRWIWGLKTQVRHRVLLFQYRGISCPTKWSPQNVLECQKNQICYKSSNCFDFISFV